MPFITFVGQNQNIKKAAFVCPDLTECGTLKWNITKPWTKRKIFCFVTQKLWFKLYITELLHPNQRSLEIHQGSAKFLKHLFIVLGLIFL